MAKTTADIYDAFESEVQALEDFRFRHFGKKKRFFGSIVTLKCFEDNTFVRTLVGKPGSGKVLVVDGAGSNRYALLGDNLASLAIQNGWSGIIINGAIRDSAEIAEMNLGVLALGTNPRKTKKGGLGDVDTPITFGNVTFTPGHHVYVDEDGVLVSKKPGLMVL
eukprot:Colp12_sorted_trinity150504_noHs@16956